MGGTTALKCCIYSYPTCMDHCPESGANLKDIWRLRSWVAEQLSKCLLARRFCGATRVDGESTVLNPNCFNYIAGELFQLDCSYFIHYLPLWIGVDYIDECFWESRSKFESLFESCLDSMDPRRPNLVFFS